MVDREKALNLLVGRYRYEDAMRLFAEYCLLLDEDWNDYLARHTPQRLRQIHRQLGAVGLWPDELVPPPSGSGLLAGAKRAITGMLTGLRGPIGPSQAGDVPAAPGAEDAFAREAGMGASPDLLIESLVAHPLAIDVGTALHADPEVGLRGRTMQDHLAQVRYQLAQELGFAFPLVAGKEDQALPPEGYVIRLQGEVVAEGRLLPGCVAAVGPNLPATWRLEAHPVTGEPTAWIARAAAGAWHGEVLTPAQLLADHLRAVVRRHAHRLFGNSELEMLLRAHEATMGKDTIHELFGRFMSLTELRMLLQAMLRNGQSIRPLPRIVDILMTHFINYLAEKPLSMDETWKLSSHIPFFSTEELVRIVSHGLGLPTSVERLAGITASLERAMQLEVTLPPPPMPLGQPHDLAGLRRLEGLERPDRLPLDSEEGAR
ncbi:MAG: FHIPEP family type III secretion protein [Candidatus Sericytochromatia bacterium]|nr:FHIPEP family type III secretion protein [Candidatus Sericytochromatia bacterium]